MEFKLLCDACQGDHRAGKDVEAGRVCPACIDRIEHDIGDLIGVDGSPEIVERPGPVNDHLQQTGIPNEIGDLLDVAPLETDARSLWLGLTSHGRVVRIDTEAGAVTQLCEVALPREPDHEPWAGHQLRHRLQVSRNGAYAAVVNDYGRRGILFEVSTGQVTKELDGGTYCPETVPFSACFAEHLGRPVLVHRTDWNRLDVSDPANGQVLTQRELTTSTTSTEPSTSAPMAAAFLMMDGSGTQ